MTLLFVLFFFFKQKTAYEMRISDWSSDVCSSDLPRASGDRDSVVPSSLFSGSGRKSRDDGPGDRVPVVLGLSASRSADRGVRVLHRGGRGPEGGAARSEERRVGKECVSTCRSRWSPDH